eukprot:COSAG02_NODE_79_length_40228_cov_18.435762_34_plen_392_part_00
MHQLEQIVVSSDRTTTKLVGVGRITDRWNPAWKDPAEEEPCQLAFARKEIAEGTVLGVYSGEVMLRSESYNREREAPLAYRGKSIDLAMTSEWGDDALVIDANRQCNELAFINDYRTDIKNYDDHTLQTREPNVQFVEVMLKNDCVPTVAVATLRAVRKNEELLLDYGDSYWAHKLTETKAYPNPMPWPQMLIHDLKDHPRKWRRTAITSVLDSHSDACPGAYCTENASCFQEQKNLICKVLETTFCTESWHTGHGTNYIRDHMDSPRSFAIVLCSPRVAIAAAMVDYQGTEAVIRMMGTHPTVRKRGCARLVHSLVADACRARSIAKLCVELSENDPDADLIWKRFGYTSVRSGMISNTTAPMFKDTKLLVMGVSHVCSVANALGRLAEM